MQKLLNTFVNFYIGNFVNFYVDINSILLEHALKKLKLVQMTRSML